MHSTADERNHALAMNHPKAAQKLLIKHVDVDQHALQEEECGLVSSAHRLFVCKNAVGDSYGPRTAS